MRPSLSNNHSGIWCHVMLDFYPKYSTDDLNTLFDTLFLWYNDILQSKHCNLMKIPNDFLWFVLYICTLCSAISHYEVERIMAVIYLPLPTTYQSQYMRQWLS